MNRFAEVDRIFRAALRIELAGRREFVERECADDHELRQEVLDLLAEDEASLGVGPLDRPALGEGFALAAFAQGTNAPPHRVPETIGQYRVLSLLGIGGMGTVYEAEQSNPRRTVALKVINAGIATPETIRRFRHEAELLARLQHPGIAQIYEAGAFEPEDATAAERPYFAMELVRGQPVTTYTKNHRLSIRQRLELIAGICDAVQHAHQRGVIHRDLKPANILIESSAESSTESSAHTADNTTANINHHASSSRSHTETIRPQPRILDFGIARATNHDRQTATIHTQEGQLLGTLPYMSPEQATARWDEVDTRTDVYALGVVAYEILAEQPPYEIEGKPLTDAIQTIAEQPPLALSTIDRRLAGDIETIINKALEKDRSRRYQGASEFAADLRRYLAAEPIQARPPSTLYQLQKLAMRHKPVMVGASIAAAIALASIIAITIAFTRAVQDRADLRRQTAIANAVNAFLNDDILAAVVSDTEDRSGVTVRQVLDEAAVAIDEGRFAEKPAIEAAIQLTIGRSYRRLGQLDRAEPHLERSRDLHTRIYPLQSEPVITAMNELAKLYSLQDRPEDSIDLFKQILELKRATFGNAHQSTIVSMSNLGNTFREQRRYTEALPLHEEAYQRATRHLDPDNPYRLEATRALASMYRDLARYEEAEPLYLEAIDAMRRIHGPTHTGTLRAMNSLANLYSSINRYDDAERLLRQALETQLARSEPGHHLALTYRHNLAGVYLSTNRPEPAATLLEENIPLSIETLGPAHRGTILSTLSLAEAYDQLNKPNQADQILAQILAVSAQLNGESHTDTLRIIERTLDIQLSRQDAPAALATSQLLLHRARATLPPQDLNIAHFLMKHARALELANQPETARTAYREALTIYQHIHGHDHPATQQAAHALNQPNP